MQAVELIALAVFCSYFSIIGGLFWVISRSLFARPTSVKLDGKAYVFIALTLASFAHTWFYMFKFMAWSFTNYEQSAAVASSSTEILMKRVSGWLIDTSLFEQAWASVCFGQVNWWWSQQLCLFTVGAWTIFLATEGRRCQVKHVWMYMLLGQLVAISVASNLFYLALVLAAPSPPPPISPARAPPALWIPVLISLGTVAASPFTDARTFLPNLLLMHSLIVVPLLVPGAFFHQARKPRFSVGLAALYGAVFVAALAMHTRATSHALGDPAVSAPEFARSAWRVLHSHPAQSSIGWDVVWTSISFAMWLILQPEEKAQGRGGLRLLTAAYLLLATPLVSVGVLAPHVLRPREDQSEKSKDA